MCLCFTVETYQKELSRIKGILKDNPKGMTVTDISREIKLNRNSVAKYLDILLISGHAEMITFGPAKVFFPARRVPLTAVLNFISDYIMVLDRELKVLQVNNALLEFLDLSRDDFVGREIEKTLLKAFHEFEILSKIKHALNGNQLADEVHFKTEEKMFYFRIQLIPTTFEDGRQGVTCIMTDITEKRQIENALKGEKPRFTSVSLKKR